MNLNKTLSFSVVAAAISLSIISARAQITAQDTAAPYTSATWTNGSNQGIGFGPWTLTNNNGAGGGFAGKFVGASGVAAIDTSSKSFGVYGNGAGYNFSAAYRSFSNSLTTNVMFKLKFKNASVSTGDQGVAGFSLRNGSDLMSSQDIATIGANSRFSFYFLGGSSPGQYSRWDGESVNLTGVPYTTSGLTVEFALRTEDSYRLVIKNAAGTTTLASFDNLPLLNSGTIDGFVFYAFDTGGGGDVHFNQFEISATSLVPPQVVNIQPTNRAAYVPTNSQITFEARSDFSGIATNAVKLTLNGVNVTNLSFTGPTTNWFVTAIPVLAENVVYTGAISVTDTNGNGVTNTFTFDTFRSDNPFIEAEDYNFSGGAFIPNSFPNPYNAYANLIGVNGIDFAESDPAGTNNAYRPGDLPQIQLAGDADHAGYVGFGYTDYNLAYTQFGEWLNYTRAMSNQAYYVYARLAGFGGNGVLQIERLANSTATTSNQPAAALGTCIATHVGGAQVYSSVPLKDFFSNPVQIRFPGTHTFRTRVIGESGSLNLNYLIFTPTNVGTLRPYLSVGFPYPGATGVALDNNLVFTIANRETAVNPASIQLFLNNTNVTPYVTLSNNAAGTVVTCVPPNFLPSNATNTVRVVFTDNDGSPVTTTNTWQFTTVNAMSIVLPPSFALPVGSFTQRGFSLRMNKAEDAGPNPPFSATIARAELQLAGLITNTVTGQPYPNLANGGPNADGSFAETNVINYDINAVSTGVFPGDTAFPYIPANGVNNNIAMESLMYLQLTNGNYVFVVRSDDGFKLTSGPTPGDTNFVMGFFDGGRGNTTPSVLYVTVVTNGLYPVRFLYYQAGAGGNVELYTTTGGVPILINDPNNPNAIQAFQNTSGSSASPVTLLSPTHTGNTTTFSFATQSGRTHYVEYKTNLNDVTWTLLTTIPGTGSPANITDPAATNSSRYYRVRSQ